ncbi:hypothetical protein LA345_40570 (plasmid) [Burkholderia vietnamiensis]|nr:hypothetical protein [Burkholderia vietnamiensis]
MNTTTRKEVVRKSSRRMVAEVTGAFVLLIMLLLGAHQIAQSVLPAIGQ